LCIKKKHSLFTGKKNFHFNFACFDDVDDYEHVCTCMCAGMCCS